MCSRIKNWRKFQHFKNRRPPWIKLYRDILDDPEWHDLDPASAKFLVTLWLLASEDEKQEGRLPDLKTTAFRLRLTEKEAKQRLAQVSNWLDQDDIATISPRYQDGPPETETETETETESEKKTGKILLPNDWKPSASHYELAKKLGLPTEAVDEAADEMRSWSLGNGERRTNWDFVFNNWLRRKADRTKNGFGRHGTLQDNSRSASRAAAELAEKAKRGEFTSGPRPGLSVEPSGATVRLLPKG
jgi:hypothetical protein